MKRVLLALTLTLAAAPVLAQEAAPAPNAATTEMQQQGQEYRDTRQQYQQDLQDTHQQDIDARQANHAQMQEQLNQLNTACAGGDQAACQQARTQTQQLRQGNQAAAQDRRAALRAKKEGYSQDLQDKRQHLRATGQGNRLERRQAHRAGAAAAAGAASDATTGQ